MEAARQVPRSGSCASGHLARGLCLGALIASAISLGVAAKSGAEPGPGVALSLPGGGSAFIGPAQITTDADVAPRTYTLRAGAGEAGEEITHGGLSVRALLDLAGLDPDRVGFVTVPRADASTAYLPGSDFAEPPPFPQGPALVWVDANSTHFFRPVLGPEDANAADNIATPGGEALALGVSEGDLLEVQATASSSDPKAGQQVSFSASAAGGLGGEAVSFRWDFGDGGSTEGAQASHAYGEPGSYEVTATASGSRESGGVSEPLTILVGDPPEAGGAGASPHRKPSSKLPPRGSGGGRALGHGGGRGSGSTGAGGSGRSGSTRGRGGGGGPGQGGPDPAVAPLASASPEASRAAPAAQSHQPRQPSPPADRQTVSGILVADTFPAPAGAAAREQSAPGGRASRPSAERDGGETLPLAAIVAAALLVAGALLEQRGVRLRLG